MQNLFLELLKLSLTGSLFAAAVMLLRVLFRKAPKWLFCVLWGVVAFRLICPVTIESKLSLVPDRLASGQIISNVGNEYLVQTDILYESNDAYNDAVEAGLQPVYSPEGYYVVTEKNSMAAPRTVGETVFPILSWVWLCGMVLMLGYAACSYLLLGKKMEEATHLRENIWQCERADSPFVLGFLKPRIYLPYTITGADMENVLAHEHAHIRRKDHWWKPIGFLLLCIHWFNPVLWFAYILLCRDIEEACDEKVIKHMEKDEIRAYSTALLHCSVHRRRIAACPLAFGEVGVKERIKRVMNYRRPAFWVILLTLVASVVACVLLLTNPAAKNTTLMGAYYRVTDVLYSTADEEDDHYSRFLITADYVLYAQLEGDDSWCVHKKMEAYPLTAKELQEYTANKNGWNGNYRIQDITDAYICRKENDWFYLAAQTKNGDTLIGIGWEDVSERGQGASDDTCLRYLYKVESEFTENGFNVNFFAHSLYEVLGVTDCFEAYTNEDNPGFMVVGFLSDYNDRAEHGYNDMGFAVFQSQNNGYRLLDYHVYEDAANRNEGVVFCDHPAVLSLDGVMDSDVTFDVILSCNSRLDKIRREYYKDDVLVKQIASTYLSGGKSMTLFRWDEMEGSDRIKQFYLDSEGNELGFEEYGEAVNQENLLAMVREIAYNPDCAVSSNPFDYIEAKKALYNEIISHGSSAVDCFVERLRSGENGLQGYIMAVACGDITGIGDKNAGAGWATAQEWLALYDSAEKRTVVPPLVATDYISGKQARLLSFGYAWNNPKETSFDSGIAPWQGAYGAGNTLVLDGENGQNQILLAPEGFTVSYYKIYFPDGTVFDDGIRMLYDSQSPRLNQSDRGICLTAPFMKGEYIYELGLFWPEEGLAVTYGLKVVMTGEESDYDRAVHSVFAAYGEGSPLIAVSLVDKYVLANAVYSSGRYLFKVENVQNGPVWVEVDQKTGQIIGEVEAHENWHVDPPYLEGQTHVSGGSMDTRQMTLSDVLRLSQLGMELTWEDLGAYAGIDIGSGLYVVCYEIDPEFCLLVGGAETTGKPMYACLNANSSGAGCDIRENDVAAFIVEKKNEALDYAIYKAILNRNADGTLPNVPGESLPTESHWIFAIETKSGSAFGDPEKCMEETTVYLQYVYTNYYHSGTLESGGETATAAAITFDVGQDGYVLKEYWELYPGKNCAGDILEVFPKEAAEQLLDALTDGWVTKLLQDRNYSKASAYLAEDESGTPVAWLHDPSGHPGGYFRFAFDVPYTKIVASCDNGTLVDLDSSTVMKTDSVLTFSAGNALYWVPSLINGQFHESTNLSFTIYDGETAVFSGTVHILGCQYREDTSAYIATLDLPGFDLRINNQTVGAVVAPIPE